MKYFAFIASLMFSLSVWGQRYVLFNPSCTERLKYSTTYDGEHVVYAVQLSDTERIFLEIGQESTNYKPRISGALISCNNPSLNRNIVNQINGNSGTTFYMVRKEGKGRFLVTPIKSASYFNYGSDYLEYETKEYAFAHNLWDEKGTNNLNSRSNSTQIFFVGTTNYACKKGYTFSVSDRNGQLSDLTILPEVGAVDNASFNKNLRLATVNATNFADYLNGVCNGGSNPVYNSELANVNGGDVDFEDDYQTTEEPYYSGSTTTTTQPSTPTTRATTTPQLDNSTYYPPATTRQETYTQPTYTEPTSTPVYTDNTYSTPTKSTYTPSGASNSTIIMSGDYNNTEKRLATDVSYVRQTRQTQTTTPTYNTTTRQPAYSTKVYRAPEPDVYVSRGNENTTTTLPVYRNDNYVLPPVGAANKNYKKVKVRTTGGDIHTVKKRETAYGIARAYGITLEQLGRCNNLSDFTLKLGQQLRVRNCNDAFVSRGTTIVTQPTHTTTTTRPVVSQPRQVTTSTPKSNYGTPAWQTTDGVHIVRNGETANSIAQLYGYTVNRFMDLNGLSASTILYPGQRLQTTDCTDRPTTTTQAVSQPITRPVTQSTQPVRTPVRTNNYTGRDLQDKGGTTNYTPSPAPYDYNQSRGSLYTNNGNASRTHIVRERETLYSIARKYGTTIDHLKSLNDMEIAETVIPGQVVFVR